jgi:hypothetical protein
MKIIFTLLVLSVLSLTAQRLYPASFTTHSFNSKTNNSDKKKEISIGSNRESGELQLHFTAGKEGEAIITILNEAGKIILRQTNQVTNSINIIPLKNATGLTEGSYTVHLISNKETYTTRFMIWK